MKFRLRLLIAGLHADSIHLKVSASVQFQLDVDRHRIQTSHLAGTVSRADGEWNSSRHGILNRFRRRQKQDNDHREETLSANSQIRQAYL